MSDTPETDSELNLYLRHGEAQQISVSWIEFARKLERERDEARKDAQKSKAYKKVLKETNARLRGTIVGWENKWKFAVDMAARAELERDDALNKIKELNDILR